MPVCLHCGELAPDGALFCTKCGYTLPQVDGSPPPPPPPPPNSPPGASSPPAPVPLYVPVTAPASYAVPVVPGATGPMAPPSSGKYCVRCRTVISRAAVYCPVCQQPQPP
ncbi:MAG TPA: zinc-ribbon domain-containing protein [Thermoplasmata archaeon]|nr:zinc-ribbon domain-containing protein [Thermoplasmata archaeon]